MQEHVQEQIDMNTLCDVFYMSRSALQHLFHKEFGCGPMEYFSRMKIRRAREMMREENCNITEIAARLSYGSVQYFSNGVFVVGEGNHTGTSMKKICNLYRIYKFLKKQTCNLNKLILPHGVPRGNIQP